MTTRLLLAIDPPPPESDVPLAPECLPRLETWQARVGEVLTFQGPRGDFWRGRLLPGAETARIFQRLNPSPEPSAPRLLWQAVPDRERMEWILQKAVELGATEIRPLWTARSNHEARDRPRQDKSSTWSRIVREAARQCRRGEIPVVAPPLPLSEALAHRPEGAALAWLEVEGARRSLAELAPEWRQVPVVVLVGPEGGWAPEEGVAIRAAGGVPVTLGPRLLRTETAAIAALSVLAGAEIG